MEKFQNQFKTIRERVNKTDAVIGIMSLIFGTFFIMIASGLNGLLHDLFISLSASIYSVGFTIVTVDGLRQKHKKDTNAPALENALRRISGSNVTLALTLAVHARVNHKEILAELVRSSESSIAHDDTMLKLSEVNTAELLEHFPENKLETDFARTFEGVSSSLNEIYTRYSYLFEDALKSNLNELIEQSDAVAKMAKISQSLSDNELNKIFTSTARSENNLSASKIVVLPHLSKYLKKYAEFVKAHVKA